MIMASDWARLALDFLAHRYSAPRDSAFAPIIVAAPARDITDFLKDYQRINPIDLKDIDPSDNAEVASFEKAAYRLSKSLKRQGQERESLTVKLILIDLLSPLPWAYHSFPPEQHAKAKTIGLRRCRQAINLARELGDLPTEAFYQRLKGQFSYNVRDLEAAQEACETAQQQYATLMESDPAIYRPHWALAQVHLARVYRERHRYKAAKELCQKALLVYEQLTQESPHYKSSLAFALRTLASVLRETGDLPAAQTKCEQSLKLYRSLLRSQKGGDPQDYAPEVALALSTSAGILFQQGRIALALSKCREALNIYRGLTSEQRQVFALDEAMLYYTFGKAQAAQKPQTHGSQEHLRVARDWYEKALEIYQPRVRTQPALFERYQAAALRNLGIVFRDTGDLDQAREAFARSAQLFTKHKLWLDSATAYYEWGVLEEAAGRTAQVRKRFERCVQRCEVELDQLAEEEWDYRDLFKGKIELAYLWLVHHYAITRPNSRRTLEKLIGCLESLRQVETLSEVANQAHIEQHGWQTALRSLLDGRGELYAKFSKEDCALLWIQATNVSVVFVTLRAAHPPLVEVGKKELLAKFRLLSERVEAAWELFETEPYITETGVRTLRTPEYVKNLASEMVDGFRYSVAANLIWPVSKGIFDSLPPGAKSLLAQKDKVVVLAPCGNTVNVPFEVIRVPDENLESAAEHAYLGLRLLMPRVHGLTELAAIINRTPDLNSELGALVVGDPDLKGARIVAQLSRELKKHGFTLIPDGQPLIFRGRSRENVLEALQDPRLCFWLHVGHGGRALEGNVTVESIPLADEDRLLPRDIMQLPRPLPKTVVYHDCCVLGRARVGRGGRFEGFPTAVLRAGASCLLTSIFPLWDDTAKEFTLKLYEAALRSSTAQDLGMALLETRQAIAAEYGDNLLVWASLIPWGNPWARLQKDEK